MIAESTKKVKRRHIGRNVQRVRMYFGVKQEALAADLGISQPEVSKIENQEDIEEGLLSQIADVLGVSSELIRDFDEEKAVYNINNINNIRDNTFEQGSTSIAQFEQKDTTVAPQINPLEKVVELYERLLQSEREKIELLKNK
ncbi:MAG: helix-turn-helix domain-containing protein [Tannerellaceae bacterium]|jgi:transcriptional regulator with XRE-family HTH domain|nr:helix-turn-helix domain-containing protein [Tannerellaceae bacterium]